MAFALGDGRSDRWYATAAPRSTQGMRQKERQVELAIGIFMAVASVTVASLRWWSAHETGKAARGTGPIPLPVRGTGSLGPSEPRR